MVSPLSRSLPGTSGCPSGDMDRGLTNPRFSLQPRRPNKSSRVGESRKQNKNPKPVSSKIQYSSIFPPYIMLSHIENLQMPNRPKHNILLYSFPCNGAGGQGFPLNSNKNPYLNQQKIPITTLMFMYLKTTVYI
jgi:hypothetical protein